MAENQRATQDFEIVTYEGKEVRQYPDGTLRGEHGHIVKQSPERAQELVRRRKMIGLQAAAKGIKKGTKSKTFAEGMEKIFAKRAEVALTDKGRAGNDAARLVAIAAGAYTVGQSVEIKGSVQHNTRVELPREYVHYLERLSQESIIEGEVNDTDSD